MSPTRRQLLTGLTGIFGAAAIPAVASTDTHAHPHSAGRYQETLDAEAQRAIDAFKGIDIAYATFVAIFRAPGAAGMQAVFIQAKDGQIRVEYPGCEEHPVKTLNQEVDLSLFPAWMAQPIGEYILELEAKS